jgi:hypothetical protein
LCLFSVCLLLDNFTPLLSLTYDCHQYWTAHLQLLILPLMEVTWFVTYSIVFRLPNRMACSPFLRVKF